MRSLAVIAAIATLLGQVASGYLFYYTPIYPNINYYANSYSAADYNDDDLAHDVGSNSGKGSVFNTGGSHGHVTNIAGNGGKGAVTIIGGHFGQGGYYGHGRFGPNPYALAAAVAAAFPGLNVPGGAGGDGGVSFLGHHQEANSDADANANLEDPSMAADSTPYVKHLVHGIKHKVHHLASHIVHSASHAAHHLGHLGHGYKG